MLSRAFEELARWDSNCVAIADVIFSSIVYFLAPELDNRDPLLQEFITIAAETILRAVTVFVSITANMQLVHRDVVLDHLQLK